jgi:hypothetical protein
MKKLLTLLLPLLIVGCVEQNGLQKETQLVKAVEKTGAAEGSYWLEKQSSFGYEWDKVILIFGYMDDGEVCFDLKREWETKYNQTYRCVAVK